MKILHVIDQFGLEYGGSSEACYQMAKALAKRGHGVVISAWRIGVLPLMPSNVLVVGYMPSISLGKPDLIHVHNYRNFANIFAWRYAKKNHIPYVFQAHGSVATFFQKGLQKRVFDLGIGRRILRDAHKLVAVSQGEVWQYVNFGQPIEKVALAPNGIDLSEYERLPERGKFRERWGIGKSAKLVLYLGRIHWMKGLDLLIKSFAQLNAPDAKLAVVGSDGGYLEQCKALVGELGIADRVIFIGALYGEKKLEAYADADVYALLSSYEIFSISVLEASACGLPVIVSENCGNAGLMPSVYSVKREVGEIVGGLSRLLNDTGLAKQMGQQGKEIVRKYTWDSIAEILEANVYAGIRVGKPVL